ncbi:MAG: hydrogenase/urease maturation nickel metallochaperone HypA [Gemmatimonadota bacterium]|jgi:Zn finger protein HypA/HybF involved in hydrogenase expression
MHEMSLALEICRITEEEVGRDALCLVREVGLVVGLDAGVEPENLEFCLDALMSHAPFTGARIVMELETGDDLRVSYLEIDDDGPPN